jgi:hypothetical protein
VQFSIAIIVGKLHIGGQETAMSSPRSRTELIKFLNYVGNKGLLSPATVESRKASVNKVLGILDDEEAADVSKIDLDNVMRRFANLHGQGYTADSLRTYKSRTKSSIDDFLRYVENPLGFKVGGPRRERRPKAPRVNGEEHEAPASTPVSRPSHPTALPVASSSIVPVPIRGDLIVYIQGLPFDLTTREAKKIANVVLAMATEE